MVQRFMRIGYVDSPGKPDRVWDTHPVPLVDRLVGHAVYAGLLRFISSANGPSEDADRTCQRWPSGSANTAVNPHGCSPGSITISAPPHVPENEEEAFFVLEGDLVFWLGEEELEAPPGTYVCIPPGTRHGFRCNSPVGRVYNTLALGGFNQFISSTGTPAPRIEMPPPEVSARDVWRELDPQRPLAPWEGGDWDPSQQVQM